MAEKVPLFRIYWDKDDTRQVTEAIESGMNWAIGDNITELENLTASYLGIGNCCTFNSGTSALHAALIAHGIGPNDEVIVPSFTFIATANAPLFVSARPVFADIEKVTFGLDPSDITEKISPKTKAIIPIHYGGCPCNIRAISEIAEDHDLILIEDAAEAYGAKTNNKYVGTFGQSAILSYCQNKVISTGEGGAVITDSADLVGRMKLIRSHGRMEHVNYFSSSEAADYVCLGYNFRMSNITAALGISQTQKADYLIGKRREAAEYYRKNLGKIPEIVIPEEQRGDFNVYQLFSVRVPGRDSLIRHLSGRGIMSKIYFPPVHLTRYYRDVLKYSADLPVTMEVSNDILSIPIFPGITVNEMDYVVDGIRSFYGADQ